MNRATFTPEAQADLRDIAYYIARRNPERAETFVDGIIVHCHEIAATPGVGRARDDIGRAMRSIPHGNYLIFYRVIDAGIEVLRVLHGARDITRLF